MQGAVGTSDKLYSLMADAAARQTCFILMADADPNAATGAFQVVLI